MTDVGTFAGVNPDGTPTHVAPGEPIESEWGNAVVDTLMGVKTNNDAQNPQIAANTANVGAAQAQANNAVNLANNAQGTANSAWSLANQNAARAFWLRENLNDQSMAVIGAYITTNGNGEFWVVFPFVLDINPAYGLIQVADINVGAWVVVPDAGNNQIHGRMFSPSGIVANLAVSVVAFLIGHRNAAYP